MISLTEAAATKVKAMATQHEVDRAGVRVMVVGGGCSGLVIGSELSPGDLGSLMQVGRPLL